ncbi:MAG: Rrf2 family transcriptional regulator, partial [Proteobacteria bacterium]|nr:Rrf2 family transcriptional regulator [Pseudomonadota bacterium]
MISITKHSDYAIVMLAHFARNPSVLISAKELSESLKLPYPTVSKLLKILVKSKLLISIQGAQGGYRLERSSDSISVASVIEAVEGPIAVTECATGDHGKCKTQE